MNCLSFLLCISTKFAFLHSDQNIPWTKNDLKINFRGLYFTLTYRFDIDSIFIYSNSIFTYRFDTYYEHTQEQTFLPCVLFESSLLIIFLILSDVRKTHDFFFFSHASKEEWNVLPLSSSKHGFAKNVLKVCISLKSTVSFWLVKIGGIQWIFFDIVGKCCWKSLTLNHQATKFCVLRYYGSGDVTFLICHVVSQGYVIEGPFNFMSKELHHLSSTFGGDWHCSSGDITILIFNVFSRYKLYER